MSNIMDKAKEALGLDEDQVTITGHKVHTTGYGLMGLTWRANPPTQEESFAAMKEALKVGANFWNGGEIYGNANFNSLHLLNAYFEKYPADASRVVISIKGGCKRDTVFPDGSAENTKRSIQECLDVMGPKKKLDLW